MERVFLCSLCEFLLTKQVRIAVPILALICEKPDILTKICNHLQRCLVANRRNVVLNRLPSHSSRTSYFAALNNMSHSTLYNLNT
jgi:hypothetical protein